MKRSVQCRLAVPPLLPACLPACRRAEIAAMEAQLKHTVDAIAQKRRSMDGLQQEIDKRVGLSGRLGHSQGRIRTAPV